MDKTSSQEIQTKKPRLSKKTLFLLIAVVAVFLIGGITVWAVVYKGNADKEVYKESISLAEDQLSKKEYADALESYYTAANTKPSEVEPYQGIVTVLLEKNLPEKLDEYLTVAQYHLSEKDLGTLYKQVGQYYYQNSLWEGAVLNYKKISQDFLTEEDELHLADAYMHIGDLDEAKAIFEKYPESESEYSIIWTAYAKVTEKTKLFAAASESQNFLNKGYPNLVVEILSPREKEMANYWEGNYYLGRAYWELGEIDNALKYLDLADSLNAIDPGVYLYLARIYNEKGDTTKSDDYYGRALSFSDSADRVKILYEYIETLSSTSRYNAALDIMSIFSTDSIDSNYQYFLLYLEIGSEENTLKFLNKVEKSLEDEWIYYDKFLYEAGDFYLSQNNSNKAVSNEERLFDRDSFSAYGYLLKGKGLLENGNYDGAQAALESAIEYDINGLVSDEAKKQLELIPG